jgi:hypothetical protein
MNERYRAISWWLTWDDMMWPNQASLNTEPNAQSAAKKI